MALTPVIPVGTALGAVNVIRSASVKNVTRPAYVVRVTIRLEDFAAGDEDIQEEGRAAPPPKKHRTDVVTELGKDAAARRAAGEQDLGADARLITARKQAAVEPQSGANVAPPFGASPDDKSVDITIVPLDLTWEGNGFRIADKVRFSAALPDLPLEPDIVHDQNARVEVQARSIEARLMDAKINPLTKERRIAKGGESLTSYVRRLISTIPEFNGSYGDAIGVQCWPNVDPAKEPRLDAKLFNRSLQSAQSRAQAGGAVQGPPPPGTDPAQDPSQGTPMLQPTSPATGVQELSVWDIIVRACLLSGVIPIYDPSIVAIGVDGRPTALGANNILLVPPQTINQTPQDGTFINGGANDGFSRSLTFNGTTIRSDVRFFVWGHNLSKLQKTRKFSRLNAPQVLAVSYNPDAGPGKRTLTAVYPTTLRGTRPSAIGIAKKGSTKGTRPLQEQVVRIFHGIRDVEQLKQIAVATYHSISGREISVQIDTNEAASYIDPTRPETENENPDILRLRPGTPCRVTVGRSVGSSGENLIANSLSDFMDRRNQPAFLRKALLEGPNASRFLSAEGKKKIETALSKIEAIYQSAKLTDWYYCRCIRLTWSPSDGFAASIELVNYAPISVPDRLNMQDRRDAGRIKAKTNATNAGARAAAIKQGKDAAIDRVIRSQNNP